MLLILIYCAIIVAASLVGGWLPSLVRLTHTRMQLVMSFVGGLMLGVSLFHLLPHAAERISLDAAILWMLGGLLLMFFLVRAFQFHQHGPVAPPVDDAGHPTAAGEEADAAHQPEHHHSHPPHASNGRNKWSWVGVAVGLGLHTAIDGVALAADVAAHAPHAGTLGLAGLGTFLAVLLHKPLDALSITSLMAAGGWTPQVRQVVNLNFALMCPIGALLFYAGFASHGHAVGCALAMAAGVFLCISLGDLLPEVQFHQHDRVKLSAALLLGLALAYGIHFIEPHDHVGWR